MIDEIQKLIDGYLVWLRDNTSVREIQHGWVEMTTPYLDRHNDHLQIYVGKEGKNEYVLTDDGYIIADLEQSGCSLSNSEKRQTLLQTAINGLGVKLVDNQLQVSASKQNFASRKHSLIQAMLAVNDLFCLAAPNVASLFLEDVAVWMDASNIRYTQRYKLTGKIGYDHVFDFVVPKSSTRPERFIQAINHANKETTSNSVWAWVDTEDVRPPSSMAYVFINDTEGAPGLTVLDAYRKYEMRPLLWSHREEFAAELAT